MTTSDVVRVLRDPVRLFSRLRDRLRDVGYLLAANVLKVALGLVTSAIIFRVLGPGDMGRLTLALSVVGMFSIIGEFGLRDGAVNYITRFLSETPERAYSIAHTFLLSKLTLSALASTAAFFAAGVVAARFYPEARAADLIRLGAVSLFTNGLLGISMVILEARQTFAQLSRLNALQTLIRATCIVALFFAAGISLTALLVLEAVVPVLVFLYSLRHIPREFLAIRRPRWREFSRLFNFSKWIAVAAIATMTLSKLDVLLLSYYLQPADVGIYAAALALVTRLNVVKQPILTTAFPDACQRTERAELRRYIANSLQLTALASVALLPLFAVGKVLIHWLYGAEFGPAAPAFYLLLLAFLVSLNAEPVAFVLYPLERPHWVAANDLLQLGVYAVAGAFIISQFGLLGAAFMLLTVRTVSAVLISGLVYRFL